MTSPDPRRHADDRGVIESILRFIPGFHGYLEKEYRRESDHLARTWLADQLQAAKRGLDDNMRTLVEAGQLDQIAPWERVRTRLDGLISQLRSGVRGYSGFFDFVRVREDLLDKVYDHDRALMTDVRALAESMQQLSSKPDSSSAAAAELLQQIDSIEQQYDKRAEMLNGLNAQ